MILVGLLASSASAQLLGLPIGSSAAAPGAGLMRAGASATFGDDFNMYGGRFTYGLTDELAMFADLGMFDPDDFDSALAYQAGGTFTLPVEAPVDIAARASIGFTSTEGSEYGYKWEVDYMTLNGGILASKDFDAITPYAYVGLNHTKAEVKVRGHGSDDDDETDVALAAGVIFTVPDMPALSFFGEVAHIDDVFFSVGGRMDL
ncbi:MAG: hypothetical protein K9N49_03865 [Candidatus Marinimicrobia bacterium]|nr:hypothetical protein [Candidatus Neomarinimicrobiota bacterium]